MVTRYDIVLYGATGFTGRQAARYLDVHAPPGLRWAIAGRNADRLDDLRAGLPSGPGRILASAEDETALDELVGAARVVMTTVGPYSRHGEELLRRCAIRGVDYVDITGETPWVRRMIDRYHARAVDSGAKVVPCCGFDSVPSDLGTHLLVDHLRRLGKRTREVRAFYRARGGINGGTIASITSALAPSDRRQFDDPFLLNPEAFPKPHDALAHRDPQLPRYDPDLGRWVAPFFVAPINTRVVRRSHALSTQWQTPYGADFRYQEYWDPGGGVDLAASAAAALGIGFMKSMLSLPGAARLLTAVSPAPGEGPPQEKLDAGYFECRLLGVAGDATKYWARIQDDGDPANRATSKFLCESALALALERDRLPGGPARAGLLTPATAFGDVLVERLRLAGTRIECPAA